MLVVLACGSSSLASPLETKSPPARRSLSIIQVGTKLRVGLVSACQTLAPQSLQIRYYISQVPMVFHAFVPGLFAHSLIKACRTGHYRSASGACWAKGHVPAVLATTLSTTDR
jgi:hypothetical protein